MGRVTIVPSDAHASDCCPGFLLCSRCGDGCVKPLAIEYVQRAKFAVSNRQPIAPLQDALGGPVRLDDPPVAVGDDHRSGELVEGAQGDGGFPAQAAQFGMQPSRLREGLQQFLKCGSTGRCERRPVIPMTYAENDYV